MLIDTHCHIHEASYPLDTDETLSRARDAGVGKLICVGTSDKSSNEAYFFARDHDDVFFSIGIHPHETNRNDNGGEASLNINFLGALLSDCFSKGYADKLVAVGEIGLDYHYNHSPRYVQLRALEEQLQLAREYDLPVSFHVREAFEDFWAVLNNFPGIRGVLHSFTDTQVNLEKAMARGLYVGVNGISLFTKDHAQRALFASIPLNSLVLETDAPFLTPPPFRGKVNEPAFVRYVAEHHAKIRDVSYEEIAHVTTANADALFAL